MNLLRISAVFTFSIALLACGDKSSTSNSNEQIQSSSISVIDGSFANTTEGKLLAEIDRLNDLCRESPDNIDKACLLRKQLYEEARKANWCWGPENEATVKQRWMRCSDDPSNSPKKQWFSHDINHASCVDSHSPADHIRDLQSEGKQPLVNDLPTGAVEIEVALVNGRSQVWTYYPDAEICQASLPKSQTIDKRYE